jgi:hypothetical protein
MKTTYEDCSAPDPRRHIMACQASTAVATASLLMEFVDNSIDAGATVIDVQARGSDKGSGAGSFAIEDNGSGIEKLGHLLRFGYSSKEVYAGIGRYGVGAKDCIYTVGGIRSALRIESRTATSCWRSAIAWQSQDSFQFPQSNCRPDDLSLRHRTGLRLEMSGCHRRMVSPKELREAVAKTYWPWLENSGNTIKVNSETVAAPAIPHTAGEFDGTINYHVDPDRWFSIQGGSSDGGGMDGVTVFLGNRAVYFASAVGLSGRSQSGVFFLVRLHGKWDADRNKNGLSEDHRDDLEVMLSSQIGPVVDAASERLRELSDGSFMDALNGSFSTAQFGAGTVGKPRRPGVGEHKDRVPTGQDRVKRRKVEWATSVGAIGDARERNSRRKTSPFMIDFIQGEADEVGRVDMDSRRVIMYTASPVIAEYKSKQDQQPLLLVAAGLLGNALEKADSQTYLFPQLYAKLCHEIMTRGSQAVS